MQCERGIEKGDVTKCQGIYCQPDGFDASRIAQNFSTKELNKRLSSISQKLAEKPESCELQHAFNQMSLAVRVK
jgi:hypothetical protein